MIDLAARVEDCCGVDLSSLPRATRELLAERLHDVDPDRARSVILELVSVGETMFWRHADQLEALRKALPRELPSWSWSGPLRVWSAGCASGEEAYSLAALFRELHRSARILGTDVNPAALARARSGRYRPWSLRRVPPAWTARWLEIDGREVRVSAALREDVRFEALDLSRDRFPRAQDLILCRNVLIYLSARARERVFARLGEALSAGGLLLLAPTDPSPPQAWSPVEAVPGLYRLGAPPAPAPPPGPARRESRPAPSPRALASPVQRAPTPPAEPERDERSEQAWRLAGKGDYRGALQLLERSLAERPLEVELWVQRAVIAEEAGLMDEATAAARRACLLAPRAAAPNFWLACCLRAVGETTLVEHRLKLVERALAELADEEQVPYSGGLCCADLRRLAEALREDA